MTASLSQSYRLLGVTATTPVSEVKAAYHSLLKGLHPDLNPDVVDPGPRIEQLKSAYQAVIKVASIYEAKVKAAAEQVTQVQPKPVLDWTMLGIEPQGLDRVYHLAINIASAAQGGRVALPLRSDDACGHCHGSGQVGKWSWADLAFRKSVCPKCRGLGRVERVRLIKVDLPEGITAGRRLRLADRGDLDPAGGRRGDLIIKIWSDDDPAVSNAVNNRGGRS